METKKGDLCKAIQKSIARVIRIMGQVQPVKGRYVDVDILIEVLGELREIETMLESVESLWCEECGTDLTEEEEGNGQNFCDKCAKNED